MRNFLVIILFVCSSAYASKILLQAPAVRPVVQPIIPAILKPILKPSLYKPLLKPFVVQPTAPQPTAKPVVKPILQVQPRFLEAFVFTSSDDSMNHFDSVLRSLGLIRAVRRFNNVSVYIPGNEVIRNAVMQLFETNLDFLKSRAIEDFYIHAGVLIPQPLFGMTGAGAHNLLHSSQGLEGLQEPEALVSLSDVAAMLLSGAFPAKE